MIVVDTTVWVDHLNDTPTPQVIRLRDIITNGLGLLVVGDLVLCEVLQGLSNAREAALVERALRRFTLAAMVNPLLASRSAANDRALRARGITVRKTMDMLIGTYCIEHGHALLHSDRDFDPMEKHLGLSVVHP
jgi:predicted nucleic acid-binding protein